MIATGNSIRGGQTGCSHTDVDMIIRGGENIYPRELEEMLFKHPSVSQVAVVGLQDERLGEVVGVFLRAAPGATLERESLFAYMREHPSLGEMGTSIN
jgi:fatty-acyl-CoA synthase